MTKVVRNCPGNQIYPRNLPAGDPWRNPLYYVGRSLSSRGIEEALERVPRHPNSTAIVSFISSQKLRESNLTHYMSSWTTHRGKNLRLVFLGGDGVVLVVGDEEVTFFIFR